MTFIRNVILSIILVSSVSACTEVPAGKVGVKFDMYGSEKDATGEDVGPGKYRLGWDEEMYLFPTFAQNYVWIARNDEWLLADE